MRIDSNRELSNAAASAAQNKAKPAVKTDNGDCAELKSLAIKASTQPEIRADKVAKAKALLEDPNYPGPEKLDQIASLLADHLKSSPVK